MTSAEALEHAMTLFSEDRWKDLTEFAGQWLEGHPEDREIWHLYGIALSSMGHLREGRRAFLCALNLDPKDGNVAVNYISSCLEDGDVRSALEAVKAYFQDMTRDQQATVADGFEHAIASGLMEERELPEAVRAISAENPTRAYRSPEEADRTLLKAAAAGDLAEVERAWEDGADVDARDRDGSTALHLALRAKHLRVADWLLQYGADPLARGSQGETPKEIVRQLDDARFQRLLDGYFPKVRALEAGPMASWDRLVNEVYDTLTGCPARGCRYPESIDWAELDARGVSFGLTRAELAVEALPVLTDILGLKPWEERPDELEPWIQRNVGRVALLSLDWIELPDSPLAGPVDELDQEFLSRYTRNIDVVVCLRLVPPKNLERLLGALYFDDREEAHAIGLLSPRRCQELFGADMSFHGWERMKWALANRTGGMMHPLPEDEH